jgi:hypothetical protein
LAVLALPTRVSAAEWGAGLHANWGGGLTLDEPNRIGTSGSFGVWVKASELGPNSNLAGRLILGADAVWPGWNAFDTVRTTLVPHLSVGAPIELGERSRVLIALTDTDRLGFRVASALELPSDTFSFLGWFDAGLGYGLEAWLAVFPFRNGKKRSPPASTSL